jgi:hypothetical protein
MSDSTHSSYPPPIRVVFAPYNHSDVQTMLRAVIKDFGRPSDRWHYLTPTLGEHETNVWQLDFYFASPHDAIIFGLKYQR